MWKRPGYIGECGATPRRLGAVPKATDEGLQSFAGLTTTKLTEAFVNG